MSDATSGHDQPRCRTHLETCVIGGDQLCAEHAHRDPILNDIICAEHQALCDICRQPIATAALDDDTCRTCNNLSTNEELQAQVEAALPDSISFRSMDINANTAYVVVHGKRLLRSNEILVLNRDTSEIIERHSVGLIARLTGGRL